MRNTLLVLFLLVSWTVISQKSVSTHKVNVLFIGNSLTYYHNMPETVQKMVNETNPNIKIEHSTFPGMPLQGHLNDIIELRTENSINTRQKQEGEITDTEKKLAEKSWDFVVLQEGTVRLLIPEVREYSVETAIAEIKKRIKNPKCTVIIFKTWPSKDDYPKQYCYSKWSINHLLENDEYCSPQIENLKQEMKLINTSYDLVAERNGLLKSENGNKFYKVLTEYPEIELYDDDIHPNEYGSFLNACVFYQLFTGKKASGLAYNGTIEPETARLLKTIAE